MDQKLKTEMLVDDSAAQIPLSPVSAWGRGVLSVVIAAYLIVVLLGPLSNPVASVHLTAPLAAYCSPLHQMMFLGHGYRFFGPDPGPSHLVEYRVTTANGDQQAGVFPDRNRHWPRLVYHRWFMLSETIFEEFVNLPELKDHQQAIADVNAEIENLRIKGEMPSVQQLIQRRQQMQADYQTRLDRTDMLMRQVARQFLNVSGGESIEFFLRERRLPSPIEVASRVSLRDSRFLSEPRSIVKFTAAELSMEELPR